MLSAREWDIRTLGNWVHLGDVRVPLVLPDADSNQCAARREGGWRCTRPRGHGGRHAAGLTSGNVVAVWHG